MLEILSLSIAAVAVLLAAVPVPGLERARLAIVLVALGCGEIHLAVLAYAVFVVVESKWRMSTGMSNLALLWGFVLLMGIGITTAVVPQTSRTYVELAQLGVYVALFLLTMNYIRSGEEIQRMLSASVIATTAVAVLALVTIVLGLQTAPSIFLARGANEGAVYLALIGVTPAAILFVRRRNLLFVAIIAGLLYLQFLATSRGALLASGVAVLAAGFFITRYRLLRAVMIIVGIYVVWISVPALSTTYQSNLNFSARERLELFNYGVWLWQQRPITGWGWGSTTDLAQLANTTLVYPHFHDTYVQLIVEAGVVGWAIILSFVAFVGRSWVVAMVKVRQSAVSVLVVATALSLTVSGFFDAMLYGADRAVQVIMMIAMAARAVTLGVEAVGVGLPRNSFELIEAPSDLSEAPA